MRCVLILLLCMPSTAAMAQSVTAELDAPRVRVSGPEPAPPAALSLGELLAQTYLGAGAGALVGGALGLLVGTVAFIGENDESLLPAFAAFGGIVGAAFGPPVQLTIVTDERGLDARAAPWWTSLVPPVLGIAIGMVMGWLIESDDRGLLPGALVGGAAGVTLSPLLAAIATHGDQL